MRALRIPSPCAVSDPIPALASASVETAGDAAQARPAAADMLAEGPIERPASPSAEALPPEAIAVATESATESAGEKDGAAGIDAAVQAGSVPSNPAATAARLAELFPALFGPDVHKPLKLRVQLDVQARAPGVFTKKALASFLHRHTTSTAYLKALTQAGQRVDLDGQPAGPISDEHREAAAAELKRRRGIVQERRAAAQQTQRQRDNEARRVEQQNRDRQRAVEARAASERAALLRAFEATTLTRANFCALKGLTELDLEAALGQARRDREQRREGAHAGSAPPIRRPRPSGSGQRPEDRVAAVRRRRNDDQIPPIPTHETLDPGGADR